MYMKNESQHKWIHFTQNARLTIIIEKIINLLTTENVYDIFLLIRKLDQHRKNLLIDFSGESVQDVNILERLKLVEL